MAEHPKLIKLVGIIVLLAVLGCTSIYQVRGVESSPEDPQYVDILENEDPRAFDSHLVKAVEARSVEPLMVCASGGRRELLGQECTETAERFKVGILEVDGDGTLNPKQRRQVFGMLDAEAAKARELEQNLVLVVFIHGWHHGAGVCDTNLACFRRLVGGLANVFGPEREDMKRASRFVGIYFAWRGESIDSKGFNALTIYNRKREAEHIGRSGATDVLLDIDEVYRSLKAKADPETSVLMVSAGHSLGGAMLLSALHTKLVGTVGGGEYIRSSGSYGEVEEGLRPEVGGYGDLSILLNPAIQAARFEAFADDLAAVVHDTGTTYRPNQAPKVLVLASAADTANRRAFPLSRWLLPQKWFQGSAERRALGHYEPYVTHELSSTLDVEHEFELQRPCGCNFYVVGEALRDLRRPGGGDLPFGERLAEALKQAGGDRPTVPPGSQAFSLKPVFDGGWDENAPFWVVRTNEGVIESHNDIYNEALMRFIVVFLNSLFAGNQF